MNKTTTNLNLAAYCDKHGVSPEQLAPALGISTSTAYRCCADNQVTATVAILLSLMEYYDIHPLAPPPGIPEYLETAPTGKLVPVPSVSYADEHNLPPLPRDAEADDLTEATEHDILLQTIALRKPLNRPHSLQQLVSRNVPLPPNMETISGGVCLKGYGYLIPDTVRQLGGIINLCHYKHPLPNSILEVHGVLDLSRGYKHPLPYYLKKVTGAILVTKRYEYQLPPNLEHIGSIDVAGYPYPLPQGLKYLGYVHNINLYKHHLPTGLEILGKPVEIPGAAPDEVNYHDVARKRLVLTVHAPRLPRSLLELHYDVVLEGYLYPLPPNVTVYGNLWIVSYVHTLPTDGGFRVMGKIYTHNDNVIVPTAIDTEVVKFPAVQRRCHTTAPRDSERV